MLTNYFIGLIISFTEVFMTKKEITQIVFDVVSAIFMALLAAFK